MAAADSEEDPQQGGRFSHDSARWQVENQAGRSRSVYARLGVAVSINSLVTALFAAAFAAWVREPGTAVQALAVTVLVVFAIGIAGAFAALRERLDVPGVKPSEIRNVERRFGEAAARRLATGSMIKAHETNEPKIARMERWLQVALICTTANAVIAPATIMAAILF